jgi:hypothetical protein
MYAVTPINNLPGTVSPSLAKLHDVRIFLYKEDKH